jgi:branched-subunit amino acid ABC-type transport system permease component
MNIAQLLYDALVVGCFYALVSMGFVLVFRVSGVFNFAQPAFMLLGGRFGRLLSRRDGVYGGTAALRANGPHLRTHYRDGRRRADGLR